MINEEANAANDLLRRELDIRLQEAVAFIRDNDPEWCQAHSAKQPNGEIPTNKSKFFRDSLTNPHHLCISNSIEVRKMERILFFLHFKIL